MFTKRRTWTGLVAAVGLAVLATATSVPAGAQTGDQAAAPARGIYSVQADKAQRNAIEAGGVDVLGQRGGATEFVATPQQLDELRAAGIAPTQIGDLDKQLAERNSRNGGKAAAKADEFPAGDEAYHTYDEVNAELEKAATDHPDLAAVSSIGKSVEGRDLNMIKISDNAGTDEDEPEVLFNCNQHAREHLTTEMCMRVVSRLTDGYETDAKVKEMVDGKEIWVVPMVNPDGAMYDIEGGEYKMWRKNRDGEGTDLNRNWDYKWGCCDGSDTDPGGETYRGTAGFSAPETKALSDFVLSRNVNGAQQIKAHIDFHTYSELVLWPFGHTDETVTEDMTQEEYDRFETIGKEMAGTNDYTPMQSSGLYITDGDSNGWMWGSQKILSYTFEMYPGQGGVDGFYPPASVIEEQTSRNDAAVDILIQNAA
ncbi:carboxypeptidase [Amycolatopsis antarctica]|uniref:Zinc carboxypeptidase n=1 Tax=Amycolatopsis antarctica TaxID=1854586 RepID=A0A263D5D9_9PSEU|nr:M14 family metallopeptidase [Amycolatopsis antarctica]OZM72605.1 carboxypeptidase [Amycolatopsis antarctica]